jgi:hypothetical protein
MMPTAAPLYLPGDKVYYTGEKFKDRLHGKPGWICWQVNGNPNAFIVEFPDTRNVKDQADTDDYIMSVNVLTTRKPHVAEKDHKDNKKQEGPEIQPRRRRGKPEEE